jgi:heme exporter protein A
MLAVAGLSCARGPRTLFRDLSFVAEGGTYVQVTGSNGSGKTTLLRTLAGLSLAMAGTIRWQGEEALAACRAYVGHAQGFKDALSVTENLLLAWQLDAEAAASEPDALAAALERVGLTRQRNLPVMRLSQGQRKRLHLARLTRSTRALWLLDEPSASLDAAGHDLLDALVSEHLAAGGIAVIATHETLGIVASDTRKLVLNG